MRRTIARVATALAATAAAVSLTAVPAMAAPAAEEPQGLYFYEYWIRWELGPVVAHFPTVDGSCQTFPADAGALVGYSGVADVKAYATADCTGSPAGLGSLRTFPAGEYRSFRGFATL